MTRPVVLKPCPLPVILAYAERVSRDADLTSTSTTSNPSADDNAAVSGELLFSEAQL